MLDYTRIKRKINPPRDGADVLTLRAGTITTVNLDGTADVTLSGVVTPNVPALGSAPLYVGAMVQMISYRGSLLIIGVSGGKLVLVKEEDQTLTQNTITMQDITDLTFDAEADAVYMIELLMAYDGDDAQDIRVAFSVPSGAVMARYVIAPEAGITSNINTAIALIRRGAATPHIGGAPAGVANGFTGWWERVLLRMDSTAGPVQLQAAQGTAGSVAPATVIRLDSLMIVERIA